MTIASPTTTTTASILLMVGSMPIAGTVLTMAIVLATSTRQAYQRQELY